MSNTNTRKKVNFFDPKTGENKIGFIDTINRPDVIVTIHGKEFSLSEVKNVMFV